MKESACHYHVTLCYDTLDNEVQLWYHFESEHKYKGCPHDGITVITARKSFPVFEDFLFTAQGELNADIVAALKAHSKPAIGGTFPKIRPWI